MVRRLDIDIFLILHQTSGFCFYNIVLQKDMSREYYEHEIREPYNKQKRIAA